MENMSTEQLREILRQDALSDGDSDLDMIIRVSKIVAEREHKVDVQAKWEEFEKRYLTGDIRETSQT